jgi:hypothetical protein
VLPPRKRTEADRQATGKASPAIRVTNANRAPPGPATNRVRAAMTMVHAATITGRGASEAGTAARMEDTAGADCTRVPVVDAVGREASASGR